MTVPATDQRTYLYLGSRPWHRAMFAELAAATPGRWELVTGPGELTPERLEALAPRYLFFVHWSWKVPDEIVERYECVNFHMTDLPYGRGGSPLQNLIVRGHDTTMLSAIRMTSELDAGPIYAKRPLALEGTAEAVYMRSSRVAQQMIREIVEQEPMPRPQEGEPVLFARRRPEESRVPSGVRDLGAIHDFIRMLDADGYPHAFVEHGDLRLELRRSARYDGRVVAEVTITVAGGGDEGVAASGEGAR